MSGPADTATAKPLTFRRFKDGDTKVKRWQDEIFDADHSHKCPTYIPSTPPSQTTRPEASTAASTWVMAGSAVRQTSRSYA